MKRLLLLSSFLVAGFVGANAGVLVLEGKYYNKNLYVFNSITTSGVGFCTYEITINGRTTTDEINSSTYEIDFSQMALKLGTEVVVEIKHKDGCTPKVINPEVLKPKPTYDIVSMNVDKNGVLKWTTKNENGSLPYTVEQFRWNKWIPVGEVAGKGGADENTYTFQTTVHSGENKFRVKQSGYGILPRYSQPVSYISTTPALTYTSSKNANTILFSGETMFEVFDMYGAVVKKGYGGEMDISNLRKGTYWLCYDNTSTEFQKKK